MTLIFHIKLFVWMIHSEWIKNLLIISYKIKLKLFYRRCLCELAKQIGFTDKATDLFNLEGQIASYMHLVSAKTFNFSKVLFYKFNFFHQTATGGRQARHSLRSPASDSVKGEGSVPALFVGCDSRFAE